MRLRRQGEELPVLFISQYGSGEFGCLCSHIEPQVILHISYSASTCFGVGRTLDQHARKAENDAKSAAFLMSRDDDIALGDAMDPHRKVAQPIRPFVRIDDRRRLRLRRGRAGRLLRGQCLRRQRGRARDHAENDFTHFSSPPKSPADPRSPCAKQAGFAKRLTKADGGDR